MNFKNFLLIISFFFIVNCADSNISTNNKNIVFKNVFSNKGFALIYNSKHYNNGLVSKKIDERSLTIFQRNLKTNTLVKITNILNNKSLVANVVGDSTYPLFNNSVISKRIAEELNLNMDEPYIEILEISKNSMFIAKKAKTFDEEKNVAKKAPVKNISINDLNEINVNKKIDGRSLVIFQKNLKTNTQVKITNILNNKSLIATVGKNSKYPSFNNSVLSMRIVEELDLDTNQPYVEILEILENSLFIAKKAKTYDEEKSVAVKAPVNDISINDLNLVKKNNENNSITKFSYIIKIGDFYFNDTALLMVERIRTENLIENTKIQKISDKKYRVYLGPFSDINSLQKSYNAVSILEFENIEIIKND